MTHKVTFLFENGFASETYTSSPPAGGASPRGEAKEDIRGRTFNSPRFDLSALCGLYPILPLIPHAVVVSLPTAGVKGASPLQLFLSPVFLSPEKEKRIGDDAVVKPLSVM